MKKNVLFICLQFVMIASLSELNAQQAKSYLINQRSDTIGVVSFAQSDSGVKITIDASNLTPGMHAIHIHSKGICTPPGFSSAGDHFNPEKRSHGFLNPTGPHAGDLPDIEVKSDGTVQKVIWSKLFTLRKGEKNSLLNGTSIVIHESTDDHFSQPSGNSGTRIACGRIEEKK